MKRPQDGYVSLKEAEEDWWNTKTVGAEGSEWCAVGYKRETTCWRVNKTRCSRNEEHSMVELIKNTEEHCVKKQQ